MTCSACNYTCYENEQQKERPHFCIWCNEKIPCGCSLAMVRDTQDKTNSLEKETKLQWDLLYKSIENISKRVSELERFHQEWKKMPKWDLNPFCEKVTALDNEYRVLLTHNCVLSQDIRELKIKLNDREQMPRRKYYGND